MTQWMQKSKTKRNGSGGKRMTIRGRDKKLFEKGGEFSATRLENVEQNLTENKKGQGRTNKVRVIKVKKVNVLDPKTNKHASMELVNVKENAGNRDYARRNVLTKNALIEVKSGDKVVFARVNSRPGQDGTINATLE